jgi:hypothetical protein
MKVVVTARVKKDLNSKYLLEIKFNKSTETNKKIVTTGIDRKAIMSDKKPNAKPIYIENTRFFLVDTRMIVGNMK